MNKNKVAGCAYGIWLGIVLFNLALGGMAVNYLLEVWFTKDIPWYGDVLIGLFVAEIAVPAAIVTWLLRLFGAV